MLENKYSIVKSTIIITLLVLSIGTVSALPNNYFTVVNTNLTVEQLSPHIEQPWYVNLLKNLKLGSIAENTFGYGILGDTPIVGDWDGDSIDTVGVYRKSERVFYLTNTNAAGYADLTFEYGISEDKPIAGDWDGDGIDTVGIYRDNVFYLRNSNTAGVADVTFAYGVSGDIPVVGDWNGDGKDTIGLFRSGTVYLRNSNDGGIADITYNYGVGDDIPVAGDWDGDGVDTVGVYRKNEGQFYLRLTNTGGVADIQEIYGWGGEDVLPITGDFNGDGVDTISIYQISTSTFYLNNVPSIVTSTPIPTPTSIPTPSSAPSAIPPTKTYMSYINDLIEWIKSMFIYAISTATITGSSTAVVGTSQSYYISISTPTVIEQDYTKGKYDYLWGTWGVVDKNGNIIQQKASGWTDLGSSKTYTDYAHITFLSSGTYGIIPIIVKVSHTWNGKDWEVTETLVAKEITKISVSSSSTITTTPTSTFIPTPTPTPTPSSAPSIMPPTKTFVDYINDLIEWIKSILGI